VIDPEAPSAPPIFDDKWKSNSSTIVVEIAALRESRLVMTLYNFLTKAAHPERVRFVVIQQNSASDIDCVEGLCKKFGTPISVESGKFTNPGNKCKYFDSIRIIRMKDTDAQGPVFARARQAELLDKQTDDFCMQIDAHTDVVKDWDVLMLNQWGAINNEYGVITSYPTNIVDLVSAVPFPLSY
jgi:hypothetical protein